MTSEIKHYKCRLEAAASLHIQIKNLPFKASDLTDAQKRKLQHPRQTRKIYLKTEKGYIYPGFQYTDDGFTWLPTAGELNLRGLKIVENHDERKAVNRV